MTGWIIGAVIVLIIIFAIIWMLKQLNIISEKMPYTLNKSILTDREKQFLKKLEPAAKELGFTVYPKVRVADIVTVTKGTREWQKWFNKISSKHIDFLLCDNEQNTVLLIELDDSSHNNDRAKKNDAFKNEMFGSRLIRFHSMKEDIKTEIQKALNSQQEKELTPTGVSSNTL